MIFWVPEHEHEYEHEHEIGRIRSLRGRQSPRIDGSSGQHARPAPPRSYFDSFQRGSETFAR
jgi:hypothetical protein